MTYAVIDIVFLLLIILFAVVATIKGFITEIFEKGAPVIAVWVSILTYKLLAAPMMNVISLEWLAKLISFLVIFIGVFLILKIIQKIVWDIFNKEVFTQLDRILGFVLGVVEGASLVILVLFVMKIQPWFDVSNLIADSFFNRIFSFFTDTGVKAVKDNSVVLISGVLGHV